MRVGIVGFGNMGSALAECISKVIGRESITVYDISEEKLKIALEYGFGSAADLYFLCDASDILVVAVKPADAESVLRDTAGRIGEKLIISTVAGLEIGKIYEYTGTKKIIRIMPNINIYVGKGTIAYVCGEDVSKDTENLFLHIMRECGLLLRIKEDMMNAFTALCGSGPAFISEFIRGLILAGIREGFDYKTSLELALNLVEGTALTMIEKNYTPEEIIFLVSSPKGTTIEGVKYMEEKGLAGIVVECIRKAKEKADEIL